MDESAAGADIREDALLDGTLRLLQEAGGHRAGTDAVLLARLADLRPGDRVVDLGSGTGAVGLIAAASGLPISVVLVERDVAAADLARRNVSLNGFENRVALIEADLFAPGRERRIAGLVPASFDLVLTNPPFAEAGARASPDLRRQRAHVMAGGTLADWIATAAELVKPRGRLHLIHRADRLADCLATLAPAFGSIAVTPVLPRSGRDAIRILIAAVRGGRAPLRIRPPTVLMTEEGGFTAEAALLHGAWPPSSEPAEAERLIPDAGT